MQHTAFGMEGSIPSLQIAICIVARFHLNEHLNFTTKLFSGFHKNVKVHQLNIIRTI